MIDRREVFPVLFGRRVPARPAPVAPRPTLKAPGKTEQALTPLANPAAPFLVEAPRQALARTSAELGASNVPGVISKPATAALDAAGSVLAPLGPIGGVIGTFGAKTIGIRGQSKEQQRATFGQATLTSVQTLAGFVPFVGVALSAAIGGLAKTGPGQRVVAYAGRETQRSYQFQKNVVQRFDFSGGEKTKAQRRSSFFSLVDQRVSQLVQGGKLDAKDVSGFKQSRDLGYRYVAGFDLATIDFQEGQNPFLTAPRKAG